MSNYKKKVGQGWKFLSIFLAIVLVVAGTLFGVFAGIGQIQFGKDKEEICEHIYIDGVCENCGEAQPEDGGAPATGEEGEELPSDATIPMPSMMTFRSSTSLDGNDAEYDSVTLTATVKPDNATNKLVDWAVSFVDASSDWATGKTATDYVTVTPAEDGSTTATVQCLQPFGEQIQITVTSRENANATASCTVDFAKRISSLKITGTYTDSSEITGSKVYTYDVVNGAGSITLSEVGKIQASVIMANYTDYTVDDEYIVYMNIGVNTDVYNQFATDKGVTGYDASSSTIFVSDNDLGEDGATVSLTGNANLELSKLFVNNATVTTMTQADLNKLTDWLSENTDAAMFKITVYVEGNYRTSSKTIQLYFNADTMTYRVTGVELNNSNVTI